MSENQRVRRCAAVSLQAEDRMTLDFAALLGGREAVRITQVWQANAAHLGHALELDAAMVDALGRISDSRWTPRTDVAAAIGEDRLRGLIDLGLVLVEADDALPHRQDQRLRDIQWHSLAAVGHMFSRWSGVDSVASQNESRIRSTEDLIAEFGPPPPHFHTRPDAHAREPLTRPPPSDLDGLMARRATCRNFDTDSALLRDDLGALLHRAFGVQGRDELAPGAVALKKNHPSGGGLHPLEAYLIVQNVEGMEAGLYHYNVEAHAIDLLRGLAAADARALARSAVAGQEYFSDAPVLLVIAARFARSFWKYRNHPKIYRAILLEAGHASQNLYLAATELGLGAFVTAAINEVEIEQAFGLDPMQEGVLAVCGFGARLSNKTTIELDPQNAVWDDAGRLR
ncbi:MAG TPA: putative peptide maturation dehydrogenase [Dokdonella sp.]